MTESNKPAFKAKSGSCEVALWNQKGANGDFRTVSMQRSYRDKDGNWQKTQTLRVNDIPDVVLCMQKAYEQDKLKTE